ncbi:hypothetical protein BDP27DRAFT_986685 [Rhodocollybia butyracea]|uniref:Uncharacterized protein n=1 Tax=Rhodocollybia butyracea TaxID=206335 RepID=A0A9P5U5I6_9AGAR|nr:hypothetical protein BDP27DRAFT_986685 [Rhodocollybia butyracea]
MDGKPTTPTEESPATSSALASLLSTTLAQVDSLKDKLKKEKQRADHFEGLATDYKELLAKDDKKQKQEDGDDSPESPATDTLAVAAEKIKQLRESISVAELVRDEEMARRLAITDLWAQLNQYIDRLETAGRDVRAGFDKVVKSGGGVIRDMFKDVPQLADGDLMRVDRHYNANGVLQQHGTRRPRSDSMDAYAYPNSKRVRYQEEHPPSFYPGHTLSPPHIQHAMMPYPQGQPAFAAPSGSRRRHADPAGAMHPPDHQGNLYPVPLNYEHERRSRRGRARSRSYSHGRSPSRGSDGSADLDEMLLATTGDQPNGNGVPGGPQVLVSGRRKDLASHGSPFVYDPREGSQFVHQVPQHSLSPHSQHPPAHHYLGAPPPHPQYAQPPSGRHSPAFNSSSRPNSSRRSLRGEPTLRDDASIVHVNHVFAPVQTGAPIKKSKFNNNSSSSANIAEESHSNSPAPNPPLAPTNTLPLASVNLAPATSPFPPTNEQGQRICRQCGMPGRYKEGKCVEKWGPGPMGPGTVCDRCRKKMKRVERRGTIEQAQLLAAQQAQNRSQPNVGNGNGNGSSGHPPPHEQRSFSVPQRDSTAKLGRTDTVIVDSSGRETPTHSFQEPAISSIRSTSNARVVASSASKSTPSKATSRPASKAASRAGSIAASSTKGSRRSSPSLLLVQISGLL